MAQLKKQVELLKSRIEDLEKTSVDDHQKGIKAMQLAFLREALTNVGRQLRNHAISKGVYDD